jgi:hypothetical protein
LLLGDVLETILSISIWQKRNLKTPHPKKTRVRQ